MMNSMRKLVRIEVTNGQLMHILSGALCSEKSPTLSCLDVLPSESEKAAAAEEPATN